MRAIVAAVLGLMGLSGMAFADEPSPPLTDLELRAAYCMGVNEGYVGELETGRATAKHVKEDIQAHLATLKRLNDYLEIKGVVSGQSIPPRLSIALKHGHQDLQDCFDPAVPTKTCIDECPRDAGGSAMPDCYRSCLDPPACGLVSRCDKIESDLPF